MRKIILLLCCLGAGVVRAETVLTSTPMGPLDKGRSGSLSVVMTEGRLVKDSDPWCGAGRRYEGRFVLRVRMPGQKTVDSDLNSLMGATEDAPLAFPAFKWKLYPRDYTGKGRPEFTLGQYASCNGWRYRILAVEADGSVRERPVDGGQTLFIASRDPSVILPLSEGGFEQRYYDNTKTGEVIRFYRWDEARQVFVLR